MPSRPTFGLQQDIGNENTVAVVNIMIILLIVTSTSTSTVTHTNVKNYSEPTPLTEEVEHRAVHSVEVVDSNIQIINII